MKQDAVSNIIGVILLLGILSVFLVVIRVDWVPEWEEAKDARMTEDVEQQLSQISLAVQSDHPSPAVYPVDLSRATSFWVPVQIPASIGFEPDVVQGQLDMQFQALSRNGQSALVADPGWSSLSSATAERVEWLRVRIPDVAGAAGNTTITFTDNNGPLGTIDIGRDNGLELRLLVGGNVVDTDHVASDGSSKPHIANLLTDLETQGILAGASGPIQINIANGLGAQFSWALESGGVVEASAGSVSAWQPSFAGGRLFVDLPHTELIDQRFSLENGALVLDQADGSVVRIPAGLVIENGAVQFHWSNLTGPVETASDSRTLGVQVVETSSRSATGWTDAFTYQFQTPNPEAWAAAWQQQFAEAGIPSSQYTIATTSSLVTLTYDGPAADASRDIYVSWTQRNYQLDIVM
ncbi:MAG: hypothetical protein ACPHK8_03895 [Thermoplasmatota archaeon]